MNKSVSQSRVCRVCGVDKPITDFPKNKNLKSGRDNRCKICNTQAVLRWQKQNKDLVNRKNRKWAIDNPEKRYAYAVKYRINNPEKIRQAERDWREKNRDKRRESVRKWQQANPEQRALNERNREAKKRNAGGTITSKEIEQLKIKQGNKCLCCGKTNTKLTLDHVIPISLGGENTIENAQMLCGSCNSRKGARHIDYRISGYNTQKEEA